MGKIPPENWRAPLAESDMPSPTIPFENKPLQISRKGDRWHVSLASPDSTTWLSAQFKADSRAKKPDAKITKIPFWLAPVRISAPSKGGVKQFAKDLHQGEPALCIPSLLDESGGLWPDPDHLPWIPRRVLEPFEKSLTIGALEVVDK